MPSVDNRPLKVFLCHAHADRDPVRTLHARLTKDGVDAWLDKANLLPGQDWELEIRKAVREADVVIVCLSKQFNQAGFRQKEVRLALDTAMEKPDGEIFIIPARLEECDTLESLRKWHWVDLFEDDGYEMLMKALRARANKIGATLQTKKSWLPLGNTEPSVIKKPTHSFEKSEQEKLNKEISDTANRIKQEMKRQYRWENFLSNVKYRLSVIYIYRLSIFFFSIAIALLIFLVFYLQKNLPKLTQALDSTPNPNQISTDVFASTKTFTPILATTTKTLTLTITPTKIVTITPTPLPTEITTDKGVKMVLVPAGDFIMGSNDGSEFYGEKPAHTAYLDTFYIDKYEVSIAMYKECVGTGLCDPPMNPNSDTYYGYYGDSKYANYPVIDVSWKNAFAYCEWFGGRLPSEAEWEKSARGTDGRLYPWGNSFDTTKANIITTDYLHFYLQPVDTFSDGKSIYGVFNMFGNASEWVNDWYVANYYLYTPLRNPLGPSTGSDHVVRGGLTNEDKIFSRRESYGGRRIGFRCAKSTP